MTPIHLTPAKWSIGPCACTQETIHFNYGNATLHLLVADLRDLGLALQKMADQLAPSDSEGPRRLQ